MHFVHYKYNMRVTYLHPQIDDIYFLETIKRICHWLSVSTLNPNGHSPLFLNRSSVEPNNLLIISEN
jgi:hypothetical protein